MWYILGVQFRNLTNICGGKASKMISEKRRRNYPSFFWPMPCTREHTLYRNTNKIKFIFIMWLQYYAHSDWALLSFNDQALLARCV